MLRSFRKWMAGHIVLLFLFLLAACEQSEYDARMVRFFMRGNQALEKGELQKAIQYYKQGIKIDSSLADLYNNRGIAYFKMREYEKALNDYNKALERKPEFPDAYSNRAALHFETSNYEASIDDLTRLSSYFPDSSLVLLRRARAKMQIPDFAGAEADLSQALKMDPDNPNIYDSRGFIRIKMGSFKMAESDLKKAISLNNEQDLAWANLGLLYQKEKKNEAALKALNRALEINPKEIYSLNQRAFLLLQLGETDKSFVDTKSALSQTEKNPEAYRNLGIYYLQKNNFSEALANLKKAEEQNKELEKLKYYLVECYFLLENEEKACNYWKKVGVSDQNDLQKRLNLNCL